jgi:hypothetical protein
MFGAILLGACGQHGEVTSGHDSDYYLPVFGPPQRIVGGRLIALKTVPSIDRTLTFAQDLGSDPTTGFPMRASGSVRLQGAIRKVHLELELRSAGGAAPPPAAQQAFADGLANSQALLDQITLYFNDRHGFKAAEPRSIPLASSDGTEIAAGTGSIGSKYVVDILESWIPPEDGDVSQVYVGWNDKRVVPGVTLPAPLPSTHHRGAPREFTAHG